MSLLHRKHQEEDMDVQNQDGSVTRSPDYSRPYASPAYDDPRPPAGQRQYRDPAQAPAQPYPAGYQPVPPVVAQDAQVQLRTTALNAAKAYLDNRIYDNNAERLAAEMDLARFFLGEK
jgi:hypothetical protein